MLLYNGYLSTWVPGLPLLVLLLLCLMKEGVFVFEFVFVLVLLLLCLMKEGVLYHQHTSSTFGHNLASRSDFCLYVYTCLFICIYIPCLPR